MGSQMCIRYRCNTRPLFPGCVINCRPIGVLIMEDNKGQDEKIIAVPSPELTQRYAKVFEPTDMPETTLKQIEQIFETYKARSFYTSDAADVQTQLHQCG